MRHFLLQRFMTHLAFLAATGFVSTAYADEVMYWITCSCQPNDSSDAAMEISNQVSEYSDYGGSGGFETGDVVVIQNSSANPTHARWEYQAGGNWQNKSTDGFVCTSNFSTCLDLTPGGSLPSPPWVVHSDPTVADVYCYAEFVSWCPSGEPAIAVSYGSATGYGYVTTFDIDYRRNGGSWSQFIESTYPNCDYGMFGFNGTLDYRVTLQSAFGNVQCITNSVDVPSQEECEYYPQ